MERTKYGGSILGESLNYARQGQLAVRDPNFKPTVAVVDIPLPAAAPAAAPGGQEVRRILSTYGFIV
jgi:hypothetical protein